MYIQPRLVVFESSGLKLSLRSRHRNLFTLPSIPVCGCGDVSQLVIVTQLGDGTSINYPFGWLPMRRWFAGWTMRTIHVDLEERYSRLQPCEALVSAKIFSSYCQFASGSVYLKNVISFFLSKH